MALVFERATELHAGLLIAEMRPEDKAEVWALSRRAPADVVHDSLQARNVWLTAVSDQTGLVAIFGLCVHSPIGGTAHPWLLGTPRVENHKLALMKHSKQFIRDAFVYYDRLENIVSDDHMSSIAYLEALGFRMGPVMHTPWGAPYRSFSMEKGQANV